MANQVEQVHILRVENGWSVVTLTPTGRTLFGANQYYEAVNVFHCLREVANFIGNIEKQESFRKEG